MNLLLLVRTGKLHVLEGMCIIDFANELDFWMIKEVMIDTCCNDKFIAKKEHSLKEMQKAKDLEKAEEEEEEDFGDGYFAGAQEKLWNLFEKPQSSLLAKWLSLWSILLVLISTTCMCINTFPWMQHADINGESIDNPYLAMIEAFCISYFTFEFLIRLAGAPQKVKGYTL